MYDNLVIRKKKFGRTYSYRGKAIKLPWRLQDKTTGNLYDSYEDYVEEQEAIEKKAKFKDNMAKGKKKAAQKKAEIEHTE